MRFAWEHLGVDALMNHTARDVFIKKEKYEDQSAPS